MRGRFGSPNRWQGWLHVQVAHLQLAADFKLDTDVFRCAIVPEFLQLASGLLEVWRFGRSGNALTASERQPLPRSRGFTHQNTREFAPAVMPSESRYPWLGTSFRPSELTWAFRRNGRFLSVGFSWHSHGRPATRHLPSSMLKLTQV